MHSPLSEIQFTPCLALHPEVAGRYLFQCFLYPNALISVNKDLDVVLTASHEHFAEDKYQSTMKMSHRPAAESLRSASAAKSPLPEETWAPASSASLALLPQATKHMTCCQQPSNTSVQALFYAHCFLWGCLSMR